MDPVCQSLIINTLRSRGVQMAPGLSENEILQIEQEYQLRFPPDLRGLLQTALPVSDPFPDWRGPQRKVCERLDWPLEGLCFDIEQNNHWRACWGERPTSLAAALEVARQQVANAPRLIPVYSHRYLVGEPCRAGNPVLSVYQTDIICYGYDLASYFQREFDIPMPQPGLPRPRPIPFWGYYLGGVWDEEETSAPVHWPGADGRRSNGYMGRVSVRDVEIYSHTDLLLYLRFSDLWLWCQTNAYPPESGPGGLGCYLWLDAHFYEPGEPWVQRLVQPSGRSPYTELAGLVVAAEDGEIQVDCDCRVIRVLVEGGAPAEGDWVRVAGTLYGEVSPED